MFLYGEDNERVPPPDHPLEYYDVGARLDTDAPAERVGDGIYAIDTLCVRPRMDASHLIVDQGRAAFVDTGSSHSAPRLMRALSALQLDAAAVDYILLTHVHLDHAGGAGRLAALLPQAQVLVHPRGAPHLCDPARLIAATRAVYGARRYAKMYGAVLPVPARRIRAVEDGERVQVGRRTLQFMHTPGHALHHLCIALPETREIFSGDTFGISYRELDSAAGRFIFATTTPTQFDPRQLDASIDRLLRLRPEAIYLTHYSRVGDVARLGADLRADIAALAAIAKSAAGAPARKSALAARLFEHWSRRLDVHGYAGDAGRRHALLDMDIDLNAAGLDAWLARIAS